MRRSPSAATTCPRWSATRTRRRARSPPRTPRCRARCRCCRRRCGAPTPRSSTSAPHSTTSTCSSPSPSPRTKDLAPFLRELRPLVGRRAPTIRDLRTLIRRTARTRPRRGDPQDGGPRAGRVAAFSNGKPDGTFGSKFSLGRQTHTHTPAEAGESRGELPRQRDESQIHCLIPFQIVENLGVLGPPPPPPGVLTQIFLHNICHNDKCYLPFKFCQNRPVNKKVTKIGGRMNFWAPPLNKGCIIYGHSLSKKYVAMISGVSVPNFEEIRR